MVHRVPGCCLRQQSPVTFNEGDAVEWDSLSGIKVFRGVIEGFFGEGRVMAVCTDQTGLGSRPVRTDRLRAAAPMYWQPNKVA